MKYNDKVKVIGGFYEGFIGEIKDFDPITKIYRTIVKTGVAYIEEKDLELIK